MKDCAGQQIEIGMECATNYRGYTCDLVICKVIEFTAKKVKVQRIYKDDKYSEPWYKFPEQICVIKRDTNNVE